MLTRPVSFYVTTPIYYVNAEPHLGHAYSTIAADVLARHMRQRGEDVFFLTGTDEHGEPVELAAEREGITPQELADRNAPRFRGDGRAVDASNDFFIRTSDPRHTDRVAEVIQRVYDNGHVYEGTYEGWYCPRCADFKTERELGPGQHLPDPRDPARARDARRTGSSASRRSRTTSSGSTTSDPDFVVARLPPQRGALVHQGRARGRLAVAAEAEVGDAAAVGSRASACTSGSTRCSTTTRRSRSPARART